MKLEDHVEKIRIKVEEAVKNTLDRCGITINGNNHAQQNVNGISIGNVEQLVQSIQSEKSEWTECFDEIVDDYAFTLFNRLVCMKVLEAHGLYPEMITQRQQHSGKSYAHYMWLENNQQYRDDAFEGLGEFINYQFEQLSLECDLFNTTIPLHMIPTATFIKEIIDLINAIDEDDQIEEEVWKQGNILSQIYEIYNNSKKAALKASGDKVEYDKVHVQSQIYTPEWVVKFLVDNSLGKLYLEMYPDSEIKDTHKIIGDFSENTREIKPLDEVKVIDPCVGSGNFLLYCFDLFYDLYMDQIENYGADYNRREVPQIIIEKNLHGIDLDERAVQLTKVGLFIKAKTKRNSVKINHYNVVSASFRLPDYKEIGNLFDAQFFSKDFSDLLQDVWKDLQQAHKFGSLLRIDEKFEDKKKELKEELGDAQLSLFTYEKAVEFDLFENNFYEKLGEAINTFAIDDKKKFVAQATSEAMIYLKNMTIIYDIVATNPPYLESDQFGDDVRNFMTDNYVIDGQKFNADLYDAFFVKNFNFLTKSGYLAMIQPQSYMQVVSYCDLRKKILSQKHIDKLIDCRFAVFSKVLVDVAINIFRNEKKDDESMFVSLKEPIISGLETAKHEAFYIKQNDFLQINNYPLTYWIKSKRVSELLQRNTSISDYMTFCNGIQTGGNNEEYFRYYWEVLPEDISENYEVDQKRWVPLNKGGDYKKWYGNQNLVCYWADYGKKLKEQRKKNKKIRITSEEHYFEEGLAFSGASSKGFSVRYQPANFIFEIAGKSIFMKKNGLYDNLGFLNSKLCSYFLSAINRTVNFQTGNLEVVPFIAVDCRKEIMTKLVKRCIELRKWQCKYNIVEKDFANSPILDYPGNSLDSRMNSFLVDYHISELLIMLYEIKIDQLVFDNYGIPFEEIVYILQQEGLYPINIWDKNIQNNILNLLNGMEKFYDDIELLKCVFQEKEFNEEWICNEVMVDDILAINAHDFTDEEKKAYIKDFIFEVVKKVLDSKQNGLLELQQLKKQMEEYCVTNIYSSRSVLEEVKIYLGKDIEVYLRDDFFDDIASRCNVYPRMAKAPFVWVISSGEKHALDVFVSCNKWTRDNLFAIKTEYLSVCKDKLEYQKSQLVNKDTAQALIENENLDNKLNELVNMQKKIEDILASDYNPTGDDGVCKNIAPLQHNGLFIREVLNNKQLDKYLKAEW